MKSKLFAAALLAALSTQAMAALTVQRSSTLTDSYGGTLASSTTGSIDIPGADTTTQITLTNFHPHDKQNLTVGGSVTRTHERANESVTNVYNGNIALTGTDKDGKAVDDTLALQNLQVVRDGNGPVLSGTIVFNGSVVDAAQLSDAQKHRVREVLRVLGLD